MPRITIWSLGLLAVAAALNASDGPSLSGKITSQTRVGGTVQLGLVVTNIGTGAAANIVIDQIALRVLAGDGGAVLSNPSVPTVIGALSAGASVSIPLNLGISGAVTRLSLSEGGSLQDSTGNSLRFAIGQIIFPSAIKSVSVAPPNLIFPAQDAGTTSGKLPISITNTSIPPVTLGTFTLTGPNFGDFQIASNNCPVSPATLATGGSCQLNLTFTPPSASSASMATLQIADDAGGSPQSVSLSGSGQSPTSVNVKFQAAFISPNLWQGTVSAPFTGGVKAVLQRSQENGAIWSMTCTWMVDAGDSSFVANLAGTYSTDTGQAAMQGSITSGYRVGQNASLTAQLISIPNAFQFAGDLVITPVK